MPAHACLEPETENLGRSSGRVHPTANNEGHTPVSVISPDRLGRQALMLITAMSGRRCPLEHDKTSKPHPTILELHLLSCQGLEPGKGAAGARGTYLLVDVFSGGRNGLGNGPGHIHLMVRLPDSLQRQLHQLLYAAWSQSNSHSRALLLQHRFSGRDLAVCMIAQKHARDVAWPLDWAQGTDFLVQLS